MCIFRVCFLLLLHDDQPYTKIGRSDANMQQDIELKGPGIQPEHCIVELIGPDVFITPLPAAHTLVNGKIIAKRTKLCHGCRVLLGANCYFQLSCPMQNSKLVYTYIHN